MSAGADQNPQVLRLLDGIGAAVARAIDYLNASELDEAVDVLGQVPSEISHLRLLLSNVADQEWEESRSLTASRLIGDIRARVAQAIDYLNASELDEAVDALGQVPSGITQLRRRLAR
jgi:predicted translin family RNA/ssDNA-binding protein